MNCKGKSLHLAATAALLWATATHAGPMSLDGQFSVSESGAATYTIPIQVPPGTGGVEPTLALTYNSQTGNGLLGVGWSLSGLSAITRCPRTLAQDNVRGSVNFDSNDRYCLDGQRLLATSGTYGADGTEYRTEREGYSKIVSYGSAGNGPAWFKVWTKAGQVIEYGHTADSRIEAIKAPSSFATWPNTTVRLWAINKVSDTKGNYLTYSYTEDPANGDYYPSRIDYTGNTNASVTPNNSVQFEYETRADVTPIYMFGNFVKSTVRLKNLKVYSNAALSSDYRLAYQSAQVTGNSIMVSLSHCNGQGACLPSVNLTWHGGGRSFEAGWGSSQNLTTGDYLGESNRLFIFDVGGDGKSDLLIRDSGNNIALKSGDGTGFNTSFDSWQLLTTGSYLEENNRIFFADVNGDGRADLLLRDSGNNINVKLFNGTGFNTNWDASQFLTSGTYLGENNRMFFADVNGDGRADMLIRDSGNNIAVKLSNGTGFNTSWDSAQLLTTGSYLGENNRIFFADVNGDGRADLLLRDSGNNIAVKFSNGNGFNTSWDSWQLLTSGSYLGENNRLFFMDINGDGRADLVMRDSGNNIDVKTVGRRWV